MGNTIRREPVNFSIPASPDYKFLNITNFRGLDVSSNPFELATNTASDCLNVYVDETNTLTTRPRLEKKELKDGSGNDILPLVGRCVGIYPLHDGYLFHHTHQMKVLHGNTLTEVMVEDTPQRECKCFEQGDKIYLLGDGRYMVIDENGILTDVDGYVPTTHSVDKQGNKFSVEPLNALSNKFIEKYFWDGSANPFGTHLLGEKGTKNNAIKRAEFSEDLSDYKYFLFFEDDTCLLQHKITGELFYGPVINNLSKIALSGTGIILSLINEIYYVAEGGKSFVVVEDNSGVYKYSKYLYSSAEESWSESYSYTDSQKPIKTEYSLTDKTETYLTTPIGNQQDVVFRHHDRTNTNVFSYDTTEETPVGGLLNPANTTLFPVYVVLRETSGSFVLKKIEENTATETLVRYETQATSPGNFSKDGNVYYNVWSQDQNTVVITYDLTTKATEIYKYPSFLSVNGFHISSNGKTFYWAATLDGEKRLWVSPEENRKNYYDSYVGIEGDVVYADAPKRFVVTTNDNQPFAMYYFDEDEPYISAELTITLNDDRYVAWNKSREKLLKSTLFTRFDNNYWFASGNTYFRSQNNDPTYFPITEYSELGDSNEDITGFNIANDTTLLAYKPSRLYLIQPFYSETTGTTEYSKTESKNTVGNTAIDAPIVTTLTEIPLQINNDGVYGLSQVSNVSAVERIADLMSEPINDRWLNEDDEVIKKAQTLNRLYWTYIILPYEKLTKVYLLDNRTNSWYYWELPIKLLNAFTKDNRAEFVDTDGNIYYLTTTDIRNMGFDTQLVTEYYDYGKKLIPWLWQSQVLYLGTMNHAKRLVNTTFILTDTDTQDGYGLQYSFKVFRKLASSVPEKELSGDLNLVRSTTKKTNISKFGFLQLKLSNITEDSQGTEAEKAYRNNKLCLVGLGLKYVLLEGLIR